MANLNINNTALLPIANCLLQLALYSQPLNSNIV